LDPVTLIILSVGTALAAVFNYFLNRAPGSEPEDFEIGPSGMAIRCDCFLNTLIIASIVILALALSSAAFSSRMELFASGALAFAAITLAGVIGRRRRHNEWREIEDILQRVVPDEYLGDSGEGLLDISSEDDEEDYDEEEP
jgi:hypothetical protein